MSAFSDEMAAVALDLIAEFGEAVTFTVTTPGAYNPTTASTGTGTEATFTGFAVPVDYDSRDIDGEVVKESDIRIYVNPTATVPAVGDQVTLDGVNYRVINVRRYVINSEDVLYEMQIRV